jgi:hypothetical protein
MATTQSAAARGPAVRVTAVAPSAPASAEAEKIVETLDELLGLADQRETFLPVTREALIERLTRAEVWPKGMGYQARRFFRYLDYWRRQAYSARLLALEHSYEPFSPDSDLLITRTYTPEERTSMQHRLVGQVRELLEHANFTRVDPARIAMILTPDSHYGLNLEVDLAAFDELEIYFRGATKRKQVRRNVKRLYLTKEEFDVPIFQRLFILFKLKPAEKRISEIMAQKDCSREAAEKAYRRIRALLPPEISTDYVYLKLFKNMPRTDLEMVFPNTRVRFRMLDKLKLGVTTGGSVGMGVIGTVGKIAVATNPVALAGAVFGLGGIAIRQAMNFINQRNRYMVTMAQNLYFHAMADNRGVMTLLADRAAEEDVKEDMLLYCVLAKETVNERELDDVDRAVEQYLLNTFGVNADFDVRDALGRLEADGIVQRLPDGTLATLPPEAASTRIDAHWDGLLDQLPDQTADEGIEFDYEPDRPLFTVPSEDRSVAGAKGH